MRGSALTVLQQLEPSVLGPHVAAIVQRLSEGDADERRGALSLLCKLESELLAHRHIWDRRYPEPELTSAIVPDPRALLEARPASVAVLNQPAASGHLNSLARFAPWG